MGALFASATAMWAGHSAGLVVVLAIVGFDLFGGAVVNATDSASRRFHADRMNRGRAVLFVACHVHPLLLALLTPEMPWATAGLAYLGILASALALASAPVTVRAPLAFLLATVLISLCVALVPPAPTLAWIVPVLVIKLLLSHLLPHPTRHD